MKKLISVLLAVILAFSSAAIFAFADDAKLDAYIFQPELSDGTAKRLVDAYEINGEYYFFIPASMNENLTRFVVNGADAYVDGVKITADTTVADVFGEKTQVKVQAGNDEFIVNAVFGSNIPNVYIETESGSLDAIHADKSHEESGLIEITDGLGVAVYDGVLDTIKGRGNSTWKMEKKPYNIKLDKKTDLFGMGKSKKWSLIANHSDASLIRNAYIYYAAKMAGLDFVPEYVPCDVYINNEYQGQYILTTRVEVDKTRVDIENLEDANEEANPEIDVEEDCARGGYYGTYAGLIENTSKWIEMPNEPDDVTGGYILEMELANRYADEMSGFVTEMGQPFTMKSPEYASKAEIEYISDYYQRFEDAVLSENGKNSLGEHYSDLIDVESFAEYYAFNEWTSNMDCGLTSTYLYKPSNDVLYAGPVWDYDIALGNNGGQRFGCDYENPEEFTVCFGRQYRNTVFGSADVNAVPTLFNVLCNRQEFVTEVKKVWDSKLKNGIELVTKSMPAYVEMITDSAVMNAIRWNIFGTYDVDNIKAAFKAETEKVLDFATKRTTFLTENFGTVQIQDYQINAFQQFLMKIGTLINELFEKLIVAFNLVNKI